MPYWVRPSITVSDHNGVLFSTKKHPRIKDMIVACFPFDDHNVLNPAALFQTPQFHFSAEV
jgi:hypothetical protein